MEGGEVSFRFCSSNFVPSWLEKLRVFLRDARVSRSQRLLGKFVTVAGIMGGRRAEFY